MLLHFVTDDKFLDDAIDLFESVSSKKNTYVLLTEKELSDLSLTYIRKNIDKIQIISIQSRAWETLLSSLDDYKAVLFHSLFALNQRVLEEVSFPVNIKVVWLCWGGDGYRLNPGFSLYLPKTSQLLKEIDEKEKQNKTQHGRHSNLNFLSRIKNKIYHLRKKKLEKKKIRSFLQKVDFFIPVTHSDYYVLKSLLKKGVKIMRFSYGSSEQFAKGVTYSEGQDKRNILIGNSCDPSNNHLDTIDIFRKIHFADSKVYMPLSYPLSKRNLIYREHINQKASAIFKNNYLPLNNFISKVEYNKILSSCSLVIFNHLRQQAKGNILTALYAGCYVVMNDHSPLYRDLISEGFKIFTLKDLGNIEISQEMILANRAKLEKVYGHEKVLSYTSDLVAELMS